MVRMMLAVGTLAAASWSPALAQTPSSSQISPVRVEFTRPGGLTGNARGTIKPSEGFMLAPAQPGNAPVIKRKKR